MARVTVSELKFRGVDHVKCLFCEKEARLVNGRLTSNCFVYWQQGDRLTLCDECAATFLPRLLADLVPPGGDADKVWKGLEATFYRSIANTYQARLKREREERLNPVPQDSDEDLEFEDE